MKGFAMFSLNLAQRHALKSAAESALLDVGPFAITAATALQASVGACVPGMIISNQNCTGHPLVYLVEFFALKVAVRGFSGWLAAKHAPVVVAPGITPGTPVSTSIQTVALMTPAVATAPIAPPVHADFEALQTHIADLKAKMQAAPVVDPPVLPIPQTAPIIATGIIAPEGAKMDSQVPFIP